MAPEGGKATPIDPGIVAKVAGTLKAGLTGAIRGASEAWFGPQQPLAPVAPEDTKGRAFDYGYGHNLAWTPRGEAGQQGIDFTTLRQIADPALGGLDMLRLAIETRKDQMAGQKWAIHPRKDNESNQTATRAVELTKRFEFPDGEHDFTTWMRMLVEDLLVIDAPCVYLSPSLGKEKIPEVVDGATIKRLIRADGRAPQDPDPAYAQSLKGMPAVHYTRSELVYMPRNERSSRIYGFSPTEQVVRTVDIALRRQLSQLEFYTVGSIPDLLIGVPPGWDTKTIGEFQKYWDALMSGNTAERRRARFVPGDMKPHELKSGQLKDEFDDWLARIICYAFSLSPQALLKQVNRASGETMKQGADEEGLEPTKLWFCNFFGRVLAGCIDDGAGFELRFADKQVPDQKAKAEITSIATGGKPWQTVDEARAEHGLPPLTDEQRKELKPPPPPPSPFGGQGNLFGKDDPETEDEKPEAGETEEDEGEEGEDVEKKPGRRKGDAAKRVSRARRSLPQHQPKPQGAPRRREGYPCCGHAHAEPPRDSRSDGRALGLDTANRS